MEYIYQTKGVCSRSIKVRIEDGIVAEVSFEGGCNGNLSGISKLAVGMRADELISKLKGTRCGFKDTSCPDQLAIALEQALLEEPPAKASAQQDDTETATA